MIDLQHLNRQTFDDPDLRREVLGMFLSELPVLMAAAAAAHGVARSEIAHRIHGSALAVGAHVLAASAAALEAVPDDDVRIAAVGQALAAALAAAQELAEI